MILNINFRIEKKTLLSTIRIFLFFIFYTILIQFFLGNNH